RVLDEGDDAVGHEPAGADRCAAAGELRHLDDPARGRDLDPPAGARGADLERRGPLPRVDHDLDPVALHATSIAHRVDPAAPRPLPSIIDHPTGGGRWRPPEGARCPSSTPSASRAAGPSCPAAAGRSGPRCRWPSPTRVRGSPPPTTISRAPRRASTP